MWFIHHFLRVIWANLFGFLVHIKYCFEMRFNKDLFNEYTKNQETWNNIRSIQELVMFMSGKYVYKWDGHKGLFDHNNFSFEWFAKWGDCDDVGHYICKKMREIYKDELEYCETRGFADLTAKPAFWHYDCVYKFKNSDHYNLFNYGHIKTGKDLNEIDYEMTKIYCGNYKFNKMVGWTCHWM